MTSCKTLVVGAGTPSLSSTLLAAGIWPLVAAGHPEHAARLLDAATGRQRRRSERTPAQCALPGCEAMTTHNGGYCCADHCREHRQRQRAANMEVRRDAMR